jgi:hypothetical protein
VAQTGQTGFHFVDEAAPPLALRDLAIELLKRRVSISWWGNIRFEKTFTPDLCRLLAASGCIAISGGLEVASDRLLALMEKGVTIAQVARVTQGFTAAGVLVHAYLMYGFPTQTAQETVDALEVVRQLFDAGIVQSGYWHRFSMTAHSPVGKNPAKYQVAAVGPEPGPFAWNDLWHDDPLGADHEQFGPGLAKSLYNYMHGVALREPLSFWFDFKTPRPTVPRQLIQQALGEPDKPDAAPPNPPYTECGAMSWWALGASRCYLAPPMKRCRGSPLPSSPPRPRRLMPPFGPMRWLAKAIPCCCYQRPIPWPLRT